MLTHESRPKHNPLRNQVGDKNRTTKQFERFGTATGLQYFRCNTSHPKNTKLGTLIEVKEGQNDTYGDEKY